jgi:Fur family transcriptional regulator, iron response regulator
MAAANMNREKIAARLREGGIKPTYQRVEIAHVLFSRGEHLSADEVLHRLDVDHSEACRATIYNTLKLFVKQKLVGEVVIDGTHFYDPNASDHHHFYDVVTGRLTDFPAKKVAFAKLPPLPLGASIERVEVLIRVRREP